MSRIVSARITKRMHEDLRRKCNEIGCTINEFVEDSIQDSLYEPDESDSVNTEKKQINNKKIEKPAVMSNWKLVDDYGRVIATSK